MKKYIIIVHVYDEENSQAYPLGGLFGSTISADKYLHEHIEEVKNNHWPKGCDAYKGDGYEEEFTATGWTAQEMYSGQSLEIEIHEMEDEDFFEVCSISKDDIESKGFDSGSLDENDMVRIASKMDDLIREGCDYWNALEGACEYWEVPRKDDDSIRAHLDDILVDDETDTGGTSFHNQTLRELLEEIPTTLNEMDITLDDDVSVLDDILKECGIKPIVKDNNDIHEVIPGTEGMLNELSIRE